MDITPPRDDIGTDELKHSNRRRPVSEADQVEPSRRIATTDEWHEGEGAPNPQHAGAEARDEKDSAKPEEERRSGQDRRKTERRQAEREVLFEARDQHERRTRLRRQEDRERAAEENQPTRRGIDIKA